MIKLLGKNIEFPDPKKADEDGIVAIGGDLSAERLVMAYKKGIFPWFNEGMPIIWHSPDPRFVLFPDELRISKSLKKALKKDEFEFTINRDFKNVITNCAETRRGNTWITKEMINAYTKLHELGIAVSFESWHQGNLAGGLYGILLGKYFCGESMFSLMDNASKVAFVNAVDYLKKNGIELIDCQVYTDYLASFGAVSISRNQFLEMLQRLIVIRAGDK